MIPMAALEKRLVETGRWYRSIIEGNENGQ